MAAVELDIHRQDRIPGSLPVPRHMVEQLQGKSKPSRPAEPQPVYDEATTYAGLSPRERSSFNFTRTFLQEAKASVVGLRVRRTPGRPAELDVYVEGDRRGALMGGRLHKVDEGNGRTRTETVFTRLL